MRTATADELRPVVEAFGRIEWPASHDEARAFLRDLDWTLLDERRGSMRASTNLDVSNRRARLSFLDEADGMRLGDVMVRVSDAADEGTTADTLGIAYEAVVESVTQILDAPVKSAAAGGFSTAVWDLPSGARVEVQNTDVEIVMLLVGLRLAHIGREEERLGIDPLAD